MKKLFALILALSMILCIGGCKNTDGDLSSAESDVVYEEVIVDQNGSEVEFLDSSSKDNAASDNESAQGDDDTATSSEQDSSDKNQSSSEKDTSSSKDTSSDKDTSSEETGSNNENVSSENQSSSEEQTSSESSSGIVGTGPVEIDYDTVVEVDICDDIVRGYLDASTPDRQFAMLNEYSDTKIDYQELPLDWNLDFSYEYSIYLSENADFSDAQIVKTSNFIVRTTTCIPGKTYYWKVIGTNSDEPLGGGRIKIKDAPVRWINADGVGNMRDMGGWKTESGKTVKYGMMYRGRNIDNMTETGIKTFKNLGMKTELDLRYSSQKFQKEGTGMKYVFLETSAQYDRILDESYQLEVKGNYKKIFELLSDKSNYPFYTHCSAGADRTGTFAFIVNGLLGVSYEDLTRDFELTSFSSSGKRWRGKGNGSTFLEDDTIMQQDNGNYVAWGELYNRMMEYGAENGCTTLSKSIECFLTNYVGVPQEQIDAFRSIMLEK